MRHNKCLSFYYGLLKDAEAGEAKEFYDKCIIIEFLIHVTGTKKASFTVIWHLWELLQPKMITNKHKRVVKIGTNKQQI